MAELTALIPERILDPEAAPAVEGTNDAVVFDASSGRIDGVARSEALGPDVQRVERPAAALCPGFLDLHFHGELIYVAATPDALGPALDRAATARLPEGTTGFLATTVAWHGERMAAFADATASWAASYRAEHRDALVGLHFEGPWIAPEAAGAQPEAPIRSFDPASASADRRLLDAVAAGGWLRMVTLAPELPGAESLVRQLRDAAVCAAVGHTRADDDALDRAIDAGMTHVTHLFNAMGPMHHREPGVAGRALAEPALGCDLICDGVHVHPAWIRTAWAAKGPAAALSLITDRIEPPQAADDPASADFGSGAVRDDGRALWLPDGRLAGSTLSLPRAWAELRAATGASLAETVRALTLAPARTLGLERERGTLRRGARADFALVDDAGRVLETWLGGRPVYQARD